MTKKNDQIVMSMLEKIRIKKEELKQASGRPRWKTNCAFVSGTHAFNLQTITDKKVLALNFGHLIRLKDAEEQAANLLGLDYEWDFNGYSYEDWMADFKTRANMLTLKEKEQELKELDARINKLVTPEQRRDMEIKELESILG